MFRDALTSKESSANLENGTGLDTEQEAQREWFCYTLAQLRAFARKYHAPAASLVETLERDLFAEGKVSKGIRDSLVQNLHP